MLRAVFWTFRQRRYASLGLAMIFLAVVFVGIGTFEIHRYREKVRDNDAIIATAHAPVQPLSTAVVPLDGRGPAPSVVSTRYRRVEARGQYLVRDETYVADQDQGGQQGFYVLTPLRTADGVLLVARGFVAATSDETRPSEITPAPSGTVTLLGRLEPVQTAGDRLGVLGHGEVASINARQQSARLGAPVYAAYLTLGSGQPGTADLDALPGPDLSNPTGGAGELQLLSYIVQWYAFALLALAAPVFFARVEVREARKRYLGIDPERIQFDLQHAAATAELTGARAGSAGAPGAALEVRRAGSLATVGDVDPQQLRRARRLADRYGRSLTFGPDPDAGTPADDDPDAPPLGRRRRDRDVVGVPREQAVRSSVDEPHRSEDPYHADYNDYLWQLALADGNLPDIGLVSPQRATRPVPTIEPRVINGDADAADDGPPVP